MRARAGLARLRSCLATPHIYIERPRRAYTHARSSSTPCRYLTAAVQISYTQRVARTRTYAPARGSVRATAHNRHRYKSPLVRSRAHRGTHVHTAARTWQCSVVATIGPLPTPVSSRRLCFPFALSSTPFSRAPPLCPLPPHPLRPGMDLHLRLSIHLPSFSPVAPLFALFRPLYP